MMHHHTMFGYKRLNSSKDIMGQAFSEVLNLHCDSDLKLGTRQTGLWWCTIKVWQQKDQTFRRCHPESHSLIILTSLCHQDDATPNWVWLQKVDQLTVLPGQNQTHGQTHRQMVIPEYPPPPPLLWQGGHTNNPSPFNEKSVPYTPSPPPHPEKTNKNNPLNNNNTPSPKLTPKPKIFVSIYIYLLTYIQDIYLLTYVRYLFVNIYTRYIFVNICKIFIC